jgi:hypothetical protein
VFPAIVKALREGVAWALLGILAVAPAIVELTRPAPSIAVTAVSVGGTFAILAAWYFEYRSHEAKEALRRERALDYLRRQLMPAAWELYFARLSDKDTWSVPDFHRWYETYFDSLREDDISETRRIINHGYLPKQNTDRLPQHAQNAIRMALMNACR